MTLAVEPKFIGKWRKCGAKAFGCDNQKAPFPMELANLCGPADGLPTRSGASEQDKAEQKTEELILMTGAQGPRRWRQRKSDYHHKLEHDNLKLKNVIVELQQQISAHQA
jgi:hypothetical protein